MINLYLLGTCVTAREDERINTMVRRLLSDFGYFLEVVKVSMYGWTAQLGGHMFHTSVQYPPQ